MLVIWNFACWYVGPFDFERPGKSHRVATNTHRTTAVSGNFCYAFAQAV